MTTRLIFKSVHLLPFFVVPILCACNFSVGYKKDLSSGLTYKYNGLAVKSVVMVGPDNKLVSDNKVQLNTQIGIIAEGVTNYELKDGKANPGMMLSVTDKNGKAVLQNDDLLKESNGYSPETAAILRGSITVGTPMMSGETYHVRLHIWDKYKPSSDLNIESDIVVR